MEQKGEPIMARTWVAKRAQCQACVSSARNVATAAMLVLVAFLFARPSAIADGGVTFHDIAAGDGAGITYRRARSVIDATFESLKRQPAYTINHVFATPFQTRGAPGGALLALVHVGDVGILHTTVTRRR